MSKSGGNEVIVIISVVAIVFYLLPTFIVLFNDNRAHRPATILINLFLGWSGIGWFIALFLSLQKDVMRIEVIEKKQEVK